MTLKYKQSFLGIVLDSLINPKSFSRSFSILKTFGVFLFILLAVWMGMFDLFFNKNFIPNSLYLEFQNYPRLGSILEEFLIEIYATLLMAVFLELLLYAKIKKNFSFLTTLLTVIYYSGIIYLLMFPILIGITFINPQKIVFLTTVEGVALLINLFIPYVYCIFTYIDELTKPIIIFSYLFYFSVLIFSGILLP